MGAKRRTLFDVFFGHHPSWTQPVPSWDCTQNFTEKEAAEIARELDGMVADGKIVQIPESKAKFISRLFLLKKKKPDGGIKNRLIFHF